MMKDDEMREYGENLYMMFPRMLTSLIYIPGFIAVNVLSGKLIEQININATDDTDSAFWMAEARKGMIFASNRWFKNTLWGDRGKIEGNTFHAFDMPFLPSWLTLRKEVEPFRSNEIKPPLPPGSKGTKGLMDG